MICTVLALATPPKSALETILDSGWAQPNRQLNPRRGSATRFFSFVGSLDSTFTFLASNFLVPMPAPAAAAHG